MTTLVSENDWRAPLLDTVSRIAAGVGLVWFLVYFVSAPALRWQPETAIIAVSLIFAWVGALGRSLPEGVRLASLQLMFIVPATLAFTLSPPGAGPALMFAFVTLLSTFFYGRRAGLVMLAGIAVLYGLAGLAWKYGLFPTRPIDALTRPQEVFYWLRIGMVQVVGTGALVAVAISVLRYAQRAMGRLREREALLRTIVEDQTEMLVRWKPDGTRTFVNNAYALFKGKRAEELIGTNFMPELGERAGEHLQTKIRDLNLGRPVVTCILEEVSVTGKRSWQEWTERGIFSGDRLVEIQSTGRDITERREAEENLRISEQRLRTIIEAGKDGLWEWDIVADSIVWSDRVYEMLGMKPGGPVMGLAQMRALIHPDDRDRFALALKEHLEVGEPYDLELCIRRGDGSHGYFLCRGKTVRDDAGKPLRMTGSVSDVTERRCMQAVLEANETLLRQFVRHTPAAVAMFDTDMRYLQVSDRWISDYHLTGRDVTGRSHYEVFPDIPEHWKAIHRRVLAGAVECCDEDPFQRADGGMEWLQWEVRPWRKAGGEIGGLIMFTQVITSRKRAEQKITDQLAELQRWQRVTLGREERISQLKGEVNELCRQLGRTPAYPVHESSQSAACGANDRALRDPMIAGGGS
jgi:PAS domain S-box-containing protein